VRVLSANHGETVGGGIFDELALAGGHELVRWLVPLGPPPGPPSSFDAIMVFGGSMHPDQDASHPWLPGEAAFLGAALETGVPLLGVCLGAQLLARAAGAAVGPAPVPEIGWLRVELTDAGRVDPVLGTLPSPVAAFQWHSYTFAVPRGARALATSDVCTQAFGLGGHAWGIQFHAEVTREMVAAWTEEDAADLPMPAAELLAETDERIEAWNRAGRALCAAFLAVALERQPVSAGSDGSRDHSCHDPT
jgi:GMP synthase (glutamine-hydrolysing)